MRSPGNICVCLLLLLQVIGVQPAASDVMRQSVAAGRIVDAPSNETLSDATAGAALAAFGLLCLPGSCLV